MTALAAKPGGCGTRPEPPPLTATTTVTRRELCWSAIAAAAAAALAPPALAAATRAGRPEVMELEKAYDRYAGAKP